MSVSFYADLTPVVGYRIECFCGAKLSEIYKNYNDAAAKIDLVELDCDCGDNFGYHANAVHEGVNSDEINVSNSNSVSILEVLGLMTQDDEFCDVCCGSMNAEDFLGRVLMALAVAPESAERVSEQTMFASGGMYVQCGRPAGYVQSKLLRLKEVAEFAIQHDREVIWS